MTLEQEVEKNIIAYRVSSHTILLAPKKPVPPTLSPPTPVSSHSPTPRPQERERKLPDSSVSSPWHIHHPMIHPPDNHCKLLEPDCRNSKQLVCFVARVIVLSVRPAIRRIALSFLPSPFRSFLPSPECEPLSHLIPGHQSSLFHSPPYLHKKKKEEKRDCQGEKDK
jgi:hypothetical protein